MAFWQARDQGFGAVSHAIDGIGPLTGTGPVPVELDPVRKRGRTTQLTEGSVLSIETDSLRVDMGRNGVPELAYFNGPIVIEGNNGTDFAKGGDSGSIVVNSNNQAIAMIFAVSYYELRTPQYLAYANPIDDILNALGRQLGTVDVRLIHG